MENRLDQIPDCATLRDIARKKLPRFVWEYLDSGTGDDSTVLENRSGLDAVKFDTAILQGNFTIDHSVCFLGKFFDLPLGVAPVGMSGLIVPNAEIALASAAIDYNFPYVLSTVSACSIERLVAELGASPQDVQKNIWFQLYCPADTAILRDLLDRAWNVGVDTLVITLDLPGPSVRERQIKSGLAIPPAFNTDIFLQCIVRPKWSIHRLKSGRPLLENLEKYNADCRPVSSTDHIGYRMRTNPDPEYIRTVRRNWKGRIILKGISAVSQISVLRGLEYDSLWISNHGGRQFSAHSSSIQSLRKVSSEVDVPLIVDGGVESAIDVLRYYEAGASMVMAGRAWHYSLGALGCSGARHFAEIVLRDLEANLRQMGIGRLEEMCRKSY